MINPKEDDVRAYPIIHPKDVWVFGPNPLADFPVVNFEKKREMKVTHKKQIRFRQLLGLYEFKRKLFSFIEK